MPRWNVPEIEDQPWCPAEVRNGMTDFLYHLSATFKFYRPIAPVFAQAIRDAGQTHLLDLCSGGGGPIEQMRGFLAAEGVEASATLTDLYPNVPAFERHQASSGGGLDFIAASVDAAQVPAELKGFRTIFTAFHHLPPAVARGVLQDAVDQGAPIAVFEFSRRAPSTIALASVGLLPALLAFAPMARPLTLKRLGLTYLLPAIPLAGWWDGVMSCLRTYDPDELRQMVADLDGGDRYAWQIDTWKTALPGVLGTYLIGVPQA